MGPTGRRALTSDCEEAPLDGAAAYDERKASGKAAEQSGRGAGHVQLVEGATAFAVRKQGETWDQGVYAMSHKKRNLMIEIPAGSGIYYQCWAERMSATEIFIRIPKEPPELSEYEWLCLTSSRIWRGSLAGKNWICVSPNSGSWKPRSQPKDRKATRKRSRPPADVEQDQMTGATHGTQFSDEEDDAGNSPSPRPIRGSNAVSPEGEEPRPAVKQHPKRETAEQHLPQVKREPEEDNEVKATGCGGGLQDWFLGHWHLIRQRGLLRHAASSGPESGHFKCGTPGETQTHLKESNKRSQASVRGQEPSCSSSSSADKQSPRHRNRGCSARSGDDAGIRASVPAGSKRKSEAHLPHKAEHPGASRSTSPATPNKHGDGYRAAQRQRSSSMDLDPRSTTAGLSSKTGGPLQAGGGAGPAKSKSRGGKSSKQPAGQSYLQKHEAKGSLCALAKDGFWPKGLLPAAQTAAKTSPREVGFKKDDASQTALKREINAEAPPAGSGDAATHFPALMETDPFEFPSRLRLK